MPYPLIVTDVLEALPGFEDELSSSLINVIQAERAAGALHGADLFDLYEDERHPGRFLVFERWQSREAFRRFHAFHRPRELTAFLPRADALLTRPVAESAEFWIPRLK
jgi:quinol monooxygenase YgiN